MARDDRIQKIWAREVINFRGNPALEAEVLLEDGSFGRAAVPAGISAGSSEVIQLLDGDPNRFGGKGVRKAAENVRQIIFPALKGMKASEQEKIDRRLIELDGTANKSRLGANAILGVSLALAYAAAASRKLSLFRYLGGEGPFQLPVPVINMIAGGAHAESSLDFQEYLVIPAGVSTFDEALQAGYRIYQALREVLRKKNYVITQPGGPLAPALRSNREGVEILAAAIEKAGHRLGEEVFIGIDSACSELFENGKYVLKGEGKALSPQEMVDLWETWVEDFPIISIEDGMAEEDWEGWQILTRRLGKRVQLVGDDLFTTNPARIQKGIRLQAANAVLIKPNQIGTLTETLEAIHLAKEAGWGAMLSSRSGETEDTTIADLSVLSGTGQLKTGPLNLQYVIKYNRLLRIAEELGEKGQYAGRRVIQTLR